MENGKREDEIEQASGNRTFPARLEEIHKVECRREGVQFGARDIQQPLAEIEAGVPPAETTGREEFRRVAVPTAEVGN